MSAKSLEPCPFTICSLCTCTRRGNVNIVPSIVLFEIEPYPTPYVLPRSRAFKVQPYISGAFHIGNVMQIAQTGRRRRRIPPRRAPDGCLCHSPWPLPRPPRHWTFRCHHGTSRRFAPPKLPSLLSSSPSPPFHPPTALSATLHLRLVTRRTFGIGGVQGFGRWPISSGRASWRVSRRASSRERCFPSWVC